MLRNQENHKLHSKEEIVEEIRTDHAEKDKSGYVFCFLVGHVFGSFKKICACEDHHQQGESDFYACVGEEKGVVEFLVFCFPNSKSDAAENGNEDREVKREVKTSTYCKESRDF